MIQTLLKNRQRPDLPPVPVCFPINGYESVYSNLEAIGIGHIAIRDCCVVELAGDYPILKRLQETEINVDELDYLSKRLESFDQYELAQFQGAAVSQDYSDMTDFINLTFCCQDVTVVQDFTDLMAVGRTHYMNLHGGLTEDELKTVDFRKTALSLLLNEEGKITPYGVVYDNGMKLEPYYDGLYFPDYRYSGDTLLTVEAADRSLPESTREIAWLYLPAEECQITRALQRAGIQTDEMRLRIEENELPGALAEMLEPEEDLFELNGFISQYRAAYQALGLFDHTHCEPGTDKLDFEGKVVVLSTDTLKESCWSQRDQLWLATGGFGCRANSSGRAVFATCLGDGEETRWNRTDFAGVLKEELLPDWAREKLLELKGQRPSDGGTPDMGGMEMK